VLAYPLILQILYLQFVSNNLSAKIWHRHNLNDQARPPCKMLRSLSLARLGVVLFPRTACLFPAVVYSIDKVFAEIGVQLPSALLMRAFGLCDILYKSAIVALVMKE
jgi:hypothetical protein